MGASILSYMLVTVLVSTVSSTIYCNINFFLCFLKLTVHCTVMFSEESFITKQQFVLPFPISYKKFATADFNVVKNLLQYI